MNNYCGTCQNYVENDPCDVCEGTENNHVYYVPDFRKRKNSPMKHGAGEHKTDDFIRRAEAINEMHNILVSPIESDDEFNIGVRRCMSSVNNIPAADVVELVRYKDNPFPQIELRYPSGYVFTITIPYEAVNHTTACLLDDIAVRVDWRKEHD